MTTLPVHRELFLGSQLPLPAPISVRVRYTNYSRSSGYLTACFVDGVLCYAIYRGADQRGISVEAPYHLTHRFASRAASVVYTAELVADALTGCPF